MNYTKSEQIEALRLLINQNFYSDSKGSEYEAALQSLLSDLEQHRTTMNQESTTPTGGEIKEA